MVGYRGRLAMSDLKSFIDDLEDLRFFLVAEGRESEIESLDAWIESLTLARYAAGDLRVSLDC